MRFLFTADWHLTDRPRDEYRFGIFDLIVGMYETHNLDMVFMLGDITDAKDKHSSRLVNRIVEGLNRLPCPIYILKGNHDYTSEDNPFFGFLGNLENVYFVNEPRMVVFRAERISGPNEGPFNILMLPHTRDDGAWQGYVDKWAGKADIAFIHQCVEGVIAENGARLSGLSTLPLRALKAGRMYAGDIHRPQTVDVVTYVGSPYNIRFGDDFTPHVLIYDTETDKVETIKTDFPRKYIFRVRSIEEVVDKIADTEEGDHVQFVIELPREERVEWPTYKTRVTKLCLDAGLNLGGVKLHVKKQSKRVRLEDAPAVVKRTNKEVMADFCKVEKVPTEFRDVGLQILGDT